MAPTFSGLSTGESLIPAADGNEVYVFDEDGRHLRTLDALTGGLRYRFAYAAGLLASVEDGSGNVTTIERDTAGQPTAIVGPFGHRTTLALNPDGYLATVENPAGEDTQLGYGQGGLLHEARRPPWRAAHVRVRRRGPPDSGREPGGGWQTLTRTDQANGFTVVRRTQSVCPRRATGSRSFRTEACARRRRTRPQARRSRSSARDGRETVTQPDGATVTARLGPDPRFGMQAPLNVELVETTPGGLRRETNT